MAEKMQQRRGTSSAWTTANPVLAAGEIGWESNTNKFKIGDGVTSWSSLAYFSSGTAIGNTVTATGDAAIAWEVKSFDTSPVAVPFQVSLSDGTILANIDTEYNATNNGYISARNVFPNRLWVTTTTVAPVGAIDGDWWLGPAS